MKAIHQRDSLVIRTVVRRSSDRSPKDLTGAVVEALAASSRRVVPGTVMITGAADGELTITFPEGTFEPGDWQLEVVVDDGVETQTVASTTFKVERSIPTPP